VAGRTSSLSINSVSLIPRCSILGLVEEEDPEQEPADPGSPEKMAVKANY